MNYYKAIALVDYLLFFFDSKDSFFGAKYSLTWDSGGALSIEITPATNIKKKTIANAKLHVWESNFTFHLSSAPGSQKTDNKNPIILAATNEDFKGLGLNAIEYHLYIRCIILDFKNLFNQF